MQSDLESIVNAGGVRGKRGRIESLSGMNLSVQPIGIGTKGAKGEEHEHTPNTSAELKTYVQRGRFSFKMFSLSYADQI
jgi:hypothetical protein